MSQRKGYKTPVEIKGGMWEYAFFAALALLSATFGWFFASRRHPKASLERQLLKDRDEIIQGQRKQIKQLTSTVNWYKQGIIPAGMKNAAEAAKDDPTPIIDAFLAAIPPNYKMMVAPFREKIIEEAKANPEAFNTIIEVIKQKAMSKDKGEEQASDAV